MTTRRMPRFAVVLVCVVAGLGLTWAVATIPALVSVLRDLKIAFPGFTLTKLVPRQEYELMLGGLEHWRWFEFELRSDDTPGFELQGRYYLEVASRTDLPDQDAAIRNSMFNRKELSRDELIVLERMWLEMHPAAPVFVLNDLTGRVDDLEDPSRNMGIPEIEDAYILSSPAGFHYFHLNATAGVWEYMPDYYNDWFIPAYASRFFSSGRSLDASDVPSEARVASSAGGADRLALEAVWPPLTHTKGAYHMSCVTGGSRDAWANAVVGLEPSTLLIGTDGTTTRLKDLDWDPDINKGPPAGFTYLKRWGESPVIITGTVRPLSGLFVADTVAPEGWESTVTARIAPSLRYAGELAQESGVVTGTLMDVESDDDDRSSSLVLQSEARRDANGVWYKETTEMLADGETEPFEGIRLTDSSRIWQERLLRDIGPVVVTFDRDAKGRLHVVKMERASQ